MDLKNINRIFVGLSFLFPFILYFMTMAPTVSLWDCGEFIATSVTMGIPHPPGTPLYLIIGNFFSQIPIFNDLGARVNFASVLASALSIMFLYMIIVYLIEEFITSNKIMIYCSSFIGAMTFAVTDSQWFNAVESEVYALSTLFTAIVVWLILRWAQNYKSTNQIKYLILISYALGAAIGIHLLNLLAIPFIGLIMFFKYTEDSEQRFSVYNILKLVLGVGISFLVIYKGINKGILSLAFKVDSLIPTYIYLIVTLVTLVLINLNGKISVLLQRIFIFLFSLMTLFITVHEIWIDDYATTLNNKLRDIAMYKGNVEEQAFLSKVKIQVSDIEKNKLTLQENLNKYTHQVIKADIAQWVQNDIRDKIKTYNNQKLNNEINYWQVLSSQSIQNLVFFILALIIGIGFLSKALFVNINQINTNIRLIVTCVCMVLIGYSTYTLIFMRSQQNPKINYNNPHNIQEAYEYINRDQYGQWDIMDRKAALIYNSQGNAESWERYTDKYDKEYLDIIRKSKKNPDKYTDEMGMPMSSTLPNQKILLQDQITDEEVTRFVTNYQFTEMYFRYFAWQFIGKEQWVDRSWERPSLNGGQLNSLPPLQGIDIWRYGIPLAFIIGLFGFAYHFYRDPYRALSVLSLFILTGIAIVIYLNQQDPQPRERDYAYVGSFFAFSIWIGIGCYGIIEMVCKGISQLNINNKNVTQIVPYITAVMLFLSTPFAMGIQDYYEHDRSKRYEAWDYAYNLLQSCDRDAILFTNGDNDTFPLWYLQQVEKIRPDVKLVNLSLLNFPSYVKQLEEHSPNLNIFENKEDPYLDILKKLDSQHTQSDGDKSLKKYLSNHYQVHPNIEYKEEIAQIFKEDSKQIEALKSYTINLYEDISIYDFIINDWEGDIGVLVETVYNELKLIGDEVGYNPRFDSNDKQRVFNMLNEILDSFNNNLQKLANLEIMVINTKNNNKFMWTFNPGQYYNSLTNVSVMKIIEQCFGKRPIYFSMTTGDNNLGLENYLIQEGLVFRLVNINSNLSSKVGGVIKMDFKKTEKMLNEVYQYRNLSNDKVFYGPHIQRVAGSYRNLYFTTASNIIINLLYPSLNILENDYNIEESFKLIQNAEQNIPYYIIEKDITHNVNTYNYINILAIYYGDKIEKNTLTEQNLIEIKKADKLISNLSENLKKEFINAYDKRMVALLDDDIRKYFPLFTKTLEKQIPEAINKKVVPQIIPSPIEDNENVIVDYIEQDWVFNETWIIDVDENTTLNLKLYEDNTINMYFEILDSIMQQEPGNWVYNNSQKILIVYTNEGRIPIKIHENDSTLSIDSLDPNTPGIKFRKKNKPIG